MARVDPPALMPATLSNTDTDDLPNGDFACFALWEDALPRRSEIMADLADHFDILGDFEIRWSDRHYNQNITRLYERPLQAVPFTGWDEKIGAPPFRFIVVRDPAPKYAWLRSVSGAIEPSNVDVVAAKYRYRDLFEKKYRVHSSNNTQEFLFQSALILGPEITDQLIAGKKMPARTITADLRGADGWDSWEDLLAVLARASRYLVLRNFEGLPSALHDADIDVLTDKFQRFASAANVTQSRDRPYKGQITVAGRPVSADIRFIGDGYYPESWESDMLARRIWADGFFRPADDDLFFSILYHCKAQKPEVKPKYRPELAELARACGMDWFSEDLLDDDKACAGMIAGYLRARGLYFPDPLDQGVHVNHAVVGRLPRLAHVHPDPARYRKSTFPEKVAKALRDPRKILRHAKRKLKGA